MPKVSVDLTYLPQAVSEHFYPLLWDQHYYMVLKGGAGSGKSHFAAQKVLVRCITEPGSRILVSRKVADTMRESVWKLILDIIHGWNWEAMVNINKTNMSIGFVNGSEIIFAGLNDTVKLKSIHGISSVWIEEATEISQDDFDQVDLRLRHSGNFYRQIMMTFNPVVITHWIKRIFFDNPNPLYQLDHSTYLDNRFLPDNYARVIERMAVSNPAMYEVYGKGNWGSLEGLIYDNYTIVNASEWPSDQTMDDVAYGLDFGFNHPMALIQIGIRDGEVWERQFIYNTLMITPRLIARMKRFVNGPLHIRQHDLPVYCDAAQPASIDEIASAGFNAIPAYKGQGSVYDGIQFCKGLKTYVHGDSVDLIREYQTYSWAKGKDDKATESPVKYKDDLMDAKRYAEFTHMGRMVDDFVGCGLEVMP